MVEGIWAYFNSVSSSLVVIGIVLIIAFAFVIRGKDKDSTALIEKIVARIPVRFILIYLIYFGYSKFYFDNKSSLISNGMLPEVRVGFYFWIAFTAFALIVSLFIKNAEDK